MIAAAVIARLKERCGSNFRLIEGAADLAQVRDVPNGVPAAYVVPMSEVSGENERSTGGTLQFVAVDFAVVIITRNLSDARGGAARGDIDPLKAAVRRALIGWLPEGGEDVVTHVSGRLTKATGGAVWWEEVFATSLFLEAQEG